MKKKANAICALGLLFIWFDPRVSFSQDIVYDSEELNQANAAQSAGDYETAQRLYREAASKGIPPANYSLGFMYFDGQGVPQDYVEAAKLFRLSANLGYTDAQYKLGVMFYKGQGVSQDPISALMWFKIASEGGNQIANDGFKKLSTVMRPADISLSERRAKECLDSSYQVCGE